jgi:GTP-binding protein HflX
VSALTGDGLDELRQVLDARMAAGLETIEIRLSPSDGAGIAWLYAHGEVLSREDGDEAVRLTVRISPADRARFEQRGA